MKRLINNKVYVFITISLFLIFAMVSCFITRRIEISEHKLTTIDSFVTYIVDPKLQELNFYWKNDTGGIIRSIENLDRHVRSKNAEINFCHEWWNVFERLFASRSVYREF